MSFLSIHTFIDKLTTKKACITILGMEGLVVELCKGFLEVSVKRVIALVNIKN